MPNRQMPPSLSSPFAASRCALPGRLEGILALPAADTELAHLVLRDIRTLTDLGKVFKLP